MAIRWFEPPNAEDVGWFREGEDMATLRDGDLPHRPTSRTMLSVRATAVSFLTYLTLATAMPALAHHFGGSSTPPPPPTERAEDPECAKTSEPVSLFSGAERLTELDLEVNGLVPIRIIRHYDSRSTYDSPIGYGWAFNYDTRLFEYANGSVAIRNRCGVLHRFVPTGGTFVGVSSTRSSLTQQPDGRFELRFPEGSRQYFDQDGRLTVLRDSVGHQLEFTYDPSGKADLVGTSPAAVDPNLPMVIARSWRLLSIRERAADGQITGRRVDFAYDPATGRTASVQAHDGRTVRYRHDEFSGSTRGNLVQVEGLDGIVSTFGYGDPLDPHNVTSIQVGTGTAAIVNTYDAGDRVVEQTRGDSVLRFEYVDGAEPVTTLITAIADENGQSPRQAIETFRYNSDGFLLEVTDPNGHVRRRTLDERNNIVRFEFLENSGTLDEPQLAMLSATDYGYDSEGNRTSVSIVLESGEVLQESRVFEQKQLARAVYGSSAAPGEVLDIEAEYELVDGFPAKPTVLRQTAGTGTAQQVRTLQIAYENHRVSQLLLSDGAGVRFEYYPVDFGSDASPRDVARRGFLRREIQVVAGADIPQRAIEYDYDIYGNVARVTNALTASHEYSYDESGRLTGHKNELLQETRFVFGGPDPSMAGPGLFLTRIESLQAEAGQVPLRLERRTYSPTGDLVRVDVQGSDGPFETEFSAAYDSAGRPVRVRDGEGVELRQEFDLAGNLVAVLTPSGIRSSFDYNAARQLVAASLAEGTPAAQSRLLVYDRAGRRVRIEEVNPTGSSTTSVAFDALGNVSAVTDAVGNTTTYEHDLFGNLLEVRRGARPPIRYEYDSRRRPVRIANARGQVTEIAYEAWGPAKQIRFLSDADPGIVERRIEFERDLIGDLLAVSDTAVPGGELYEVARDALGRPTEVEVRYIPGGSRRLRYEYDGLGNRSALEIVDSGEVLRHEYDLDARGRIRQARFPGAQVLDLTPRLNDTIARIDRTSGVSTALTYDQNGALAAVDIASSSGAVATLSYVRDALQRVAMLTEDVTGIGSTTEFMYDDVGNLLSSLGAVTGPETFSWDAAGNRTSNGFSYGPDNEILTSPGRSYQSDADGNLVRILGDPDGTASLDWDRQNRLAAFVKGAVDASYLYDHEGRRIRKTLGGADRWYVWDEDQLVAEYDASGVRDVRYAYLGSESPLQVAYASSGAEEIYDVHADERGAAVLLTDSAGATVWTASYSAFGEASVDSSSGLIFNPRFPGQYFDEESGLHYNRFRYYDPRIQRYISVDPIGQEGGVNPYLYAANDPINFVDPLGLRPCAPRTACRGKLRDLFDLRDLLKKTIELYKPGPGGDGRGGFLRFPPGSPNQDFTKPGGHYLKIRNRQREGTKKLKDYFENCINCDRDPGEPPNPPAPQDLKELCKRPIQKPVFPDPETEREFEDKLKDLGLLAQIAAALSALAALGLALARAPQRALDYALGVLVRIQILGGALGPGGPPPDA